MLHFNKQININSCMSVKIAFNFLSWILFHLIFTVIFGIV